MLPSLAALGAGLTLISCAIAPDAARAQTTAPCAATTDPATPAKPAPGAPCWTEVDPYPFGALGEPVDTSSPVCRPDSIDPRSCYLVVASMAFRAWNRGIAATPKTASGGATPFGIWLFNGTRWSPDPTFPGPAACPGDTVVWAGKLDYWLVGPKTGGNWQRVCRYDGANFTWQPLDVPDATRSRVWNKPRSESGARPAFGALRTAACFAWNDCRLFGDYGAIARWDGNVLADASPSPDQQPWLSGQVLAAAQGTDAAGAPFGVAAGSSFGGSDGSPAGATTMIMDRVSPTLPGPLLARPDGTPAPQVSVSRGGAFSPLGLAVPTAPRERDPSRTDLVAAALGPGGRGWLAGQPTGFRVDPDGASSTIRGGLVTSPEPSPLVPFSSQGRREGCPGPAADRLTWMPADHANGRAGYLWTSLTVFPATGDALAGGTERPAAAGTWRNDDGKDEPVLVRAACAGTVSETRFRVPDKTYAGSGAAPLVPASHGGTATSVAATAENDAWAATGPGSLVDDAGATVYQRPRFYRLTDTRPPAAPAGDDDESRPPVFQEDPPIFVEEPSLPEPEPIPQPTVTQPGTTTTKRVKLKPAVYAVGSHTRTTKQRVTLYVTFKVRRPVTIGVEAMRGKKVVAKSGLKRFKGKRGELVLKLDRKRWPTRIRFVTEEPASSAAIPPAWRAVGRLRP